MTTPASGQISFSQLQTTFGGSNPISLSEYYAGGSYVLSNTSGSGGPLPTSGQVAMSDYYSPISVQATINFTSATDAGGGDLSWNSTESYFNNSTSNYASTNTLVSTATSNVLQTTGPETLIPTDCTITNIQIRCYADLYGTSSGTDARRFITRAVSSATTKNTSISRTNTSPAWFTCGNGNLTYWSVSNANAVTGMRTSASGPSYQCECTTFDVDTQDFRMYQSQAIVTYTIA